MDPAVHPAVHPAALALHSTAEARATDAAAVAAGDTFDGLMSRAAGHLARTVLEVARRGAGLRVDVVVGRGDNGGDGWAAAPLLAARGAHVRVLAPDGVDVATSEASERARGRWLARGGTVRTGPVTPHVIGPDGRTRADVVVDCLLGTGATGPLRGAVTEAAGAIMAARAGGALVVSCDVPTGLGADDGTVAEGAVVADATITFGALKRGMLLAPGSAHVGQIHIGRLGPRFLPPTPGRWWTLGVDAARPGRADTAVEKRGRGTVLVVAGRAGTAGAAVLAGRGALAAGAGLVTLAVPETIRAEVAALHPALMTVGLPADAQGAIHADAVHAIALDGIDAVVAGPGLGTGPGAAAVVAMLRATCPRLVLDADALNVHRDSPSDLAEHPRGPDTALVLTPHLRELDRLGGAGTYAARAGRVPELAAEWGVHIVAKGPGTLCVTPDGTVIVGPVSVPALATAGTGDVLAGMLGAALAARGTDDALSLRIARTVWCHAAAGHLAGAASGDRIDALAVLRAIPDVFAALATGPATGQNTGSPAGSAPRDPGPAGRILLEHIMLESILHGPPQGRHGHQPHRSVASAGRPST